MSVEIYIEDEEESRRIVTKDGSLVLEVLLKNRLDIRHVCGGMGTCGTCQVYILNINEGSRPRNEIELEIASDRGWQDTLRLACQTEVFQNMRIKKPI